MKESICLIFLEQTISKADDTYVLNIESEMEDVSALEVYQEVAECNMIHENEDIDEYNLTKDAIMHAIFEALNLVGKTNSSLNNFGNLLEMAKRMYCRGAQLDPNHDLPEWPTNWSDTQKILQELGYKDAKEYHVCLNDAHPCQWDILENKHDRCRHCDEPGNISYYYLGLETKVKLWVSDNAMCYKMTSHWREKDHWFQRNNGGWYVKKEVWDGSRFEELSWFFDKDSCWCLPVRCQAENCKNIVSPETVQSLPQTDVTRKRIVCDECHNAFDFTLVYAHGDPRNIALIGKLLKSVDAFTC